MESIVEQLKKDDVQSRLDAVSQFETVPVDSREQLFKIVFEDFNHEVREAAANLIALCPSMFPTFLTDPDPDVRVAVVTNSVDVRRCLPSPELILARLADVVRDSAVEVRCALARVLHQHAKVDPANDPKTLVVQMIVPLIEQLLKDFHDDVRVAASLNLRELTVQFGFDFVFENVHRCMQYMLTDMQWRVRNNAVELLFGLALVCSREFFDHHLFEFLLKFLQDPCCKVRQFALMALPSLAQHFGYEWLKTRLMESLQRMADSENFMERETYLFSISALVGFFPVQYQSNYVFQPMIRLLNDPIHNVILLALELLAQHKDAIHPFRRQYELKPILESLIETSPPTIKERAQAFLSACH
jgi:HEAT repeat protein